MPTRKSYHEPTLAAVPTPPATAEHARLAEAATYNHAWRLWGPFLAERQWGTVHEDYSAAGDAWTYFPFEHAASRAYRWGEDGLAGFSDRDCRLCLSLALWNGRDPLLKERLFGLTNEQGNHGEDVKEVYYYLDATPTHSYLKLLYKYPQAEFPYARLAEESRRRGKQDTEFELLDTGLFDDDRYWDVFVEYAKASTDDILMLVTVHNRGPDEATIHVLPQLWFRNTWSWTGDATNKPQLRAVDPHTVLAEQHELGRYRWSADGSPALLFCENDTNPAHAFNDAEKAGFFKDAFHDYVVHGKSAAVNPANRGTKAAAHYVLTVPGGGVASGASVVDRS